MASRGLKPPQELLEALTSDTPSTSHTIIVAAKLRSPPYAALEGAARGDKVARPSDVWSFDCIIFQILARSGLNGKAQMNELNRLRTLGRDLVTRHPTDFFYRVKDGSKYLDPHVEDWLRSNGLVESFLIKQRKGLVLDMLNINPNLRPKSFQVNERLSSIAHIQQVHSRQTSIRSPIPEEDETAPSIKNSD